MIPLLPLRLTFRPEAAVDLPHYPGGIWRSALGARLRRVACITGAPTCDGCPVVARCTYGQLYETPAPRNLDPALARYREVPHPFVVSPVHRGGRVAAGQALSVDLVLLPGAVSGPAALASALRGLEIHRVPLRLDGAEIRPPAGGGAPEPTDLRRALAAAPARPEPPAPAHRCRLVFEHPLRLRRQNRYLGPAELAFAPFANTLVRRISMLAALTGAPPGHDPRALSDAASRARIEASDLQWRDWHRHSRRQGRRIPMGGVTGEMTLSNLDEHLWPWLWLGQWVHAGKGAVMGLGRYRIEPA